MRATLSSLSRRIKASARVARLAARSNMSIEQLIESQNVMVACEGTEQGSSGWYEHDGERSEWEVNMKTGEWIQLQ